MLIKNDLFSNHGLHVLVDGQYGSTGKGALAAWLASCSVAYKIPFCAVISNAGPNSGHTFYHEDQKIVLKQLPTFAVMSHLLGHTIPIHLSAGAIIDPEQLRKEATRFEGIPIVIHPNAAVITDQDRRSEADAAGTIAAVAGTRSGTGMALARKVMRDPTAIWGNNPMRMPGNVRTQVTPPFHITNHRYFMEISQGFSLGLNQPFYPKTTSRECTVAQGIADAGLSPRCLSRVYMAVRTFPIRVGNVDGHSSGGWYPDQEETSWEELGVDAERTTVTNRIRRVATFSFEQLEDALMANEPDFLFMNFMNYLSPDDQEAFVAKLMEWRDGMHRWFDIIGGYGPRVGDVRYV
jgi:adenylosuccinate synthase